MTESENSRKSDDYLRQLPGDEQRDEAFETIKAYDDIFSKPWYESDTTPAEKESDIAKDAAAKRAVMASLEKHLQPINSDDQNPVLTANKPNNYHITNGTSPNMSSNEEFDHGQPLEMSDAADLAAELNLIKGGALTGPPSPAAASSASHDMPKRVETAQIKHDLQSKLTSELNALINSGDADQKARDEQLRLGKASKNIDNMIAKANRPVREAYRAGQAGYRQGFESWQSNLPDTNNSIEPEPSVEPTPSTPENPPAAPVDIMADRQHLENELAVPDARALWEAHAPDRANITAALRRAAEEKTAREKLFTGGRHVESYNEALSGVEGAYSEYLNVVGGSMAAIEENIKYVSEQTTSILASSRDRLAAIDSLPEGDEKNALIAERDQLQEIVEAANAKLAELETVRADITRQMTLELAIVRSMVEKSQNDSKQGKFLGKFRNWYKAHPVMRAGIGATLAVSGVLTGGATAPAYMAWRGVGGYMAGEGVYNVGHNIRGNRAEARADRSATSQESFRNRSTRNSEMTNMAERWDLNEQQAQDLENFMLRHGNDLFGPEGLQKIMSGNTEQTAEITKALLTDQLDRLRRDAGAARKAKIAGVITGAVSLGVGAYLNRAHDVANNRPTGGNPTDTPTGTPEPSPIPRPGPGGGPTVDFSDPNQARDFSRMVGIADSGKGQEWMDWAARGAPGDSAERLNLLNMSRNDLIARFRLDGHQSALLDRLSGRLSQTPNVGSERLLHSLPGLARDISEAGRVGLSDDQITQAALAKFGG